jgi:hypothetical protein
MSSIEERLMLDIAAVTKGVVVTERDLLDAQRAVDERVDSRRGDHRRTIAVVAAAAVVVAGVGVGAFQVFGGEEQEVTPAGSGPSVDIYADFLVGEAPTPENLNGFWRLDNGVTMVRFQTDGTVQFSDQGTVISDPVTMGTYTIDGDTIAVTTTAAPRCASSDFTVRATLPEPGLANVVLTDPQFGTCGTVATTIALEKVLPAKGYLADLLGPDVRGWQPVTNKSVLYGDWMAEGGGYLLEMAPDGSYYVADESTETVDQGAWTWGDSGLTLTSSADSALCRSGDRYVLGGVEQVDLGTSVLRGTVEENTCDGGWTPDRWIQIPDATTG